VSANRPTDRSKSEDAASGLRKLNAADSDVIVTRRRVASLNLPLRIRPFVSRANALTSP